MSTGKIFISYRWDDSSGYTLSIRRALLPHYPAEQIFYDLSTIAFGEDFVEAIQNAVGACDVLLAIIGKQWLNIKNEEGARRLDDPYDFVRLEIATALERKILVIPVLVGGARMPKESDLPEDLKKLARRKALAVDDADFDDDMDKLVTAIGRGLAKTSPHAPSRPSGTASLATPIQAGESDSPSLYSERGLGGEVMAAELTRLTRAALSNDPLFEWVFIRGSDGKKIVLEKHGDSYPVADFFMAKYQTTNRQYQVFVDAPDGYADPRWWDYSKDARAWRQARPKMGDTAFKGDDLPRTNVSWYDSVAFTRWLDWKVGESGSPSLYSERGRGGEVRLPTEWEWQWAALRDTGWDYPWGNEITAEYAVYDAKQPAPVGSKPKGASPDGLLDMAGNVWEWCLNDYSSLDANLVNSSNNRAYGLMGGSFDFTTNVLRASYRVEVRPDVVFYVIGFRCLCSY
jgi:formylglycine-generating enzyme required for sulfatase activity